jgi:hypothetical protein
LTASLGRECVFGLPRLITCTVLHFNETINPQVTLELLSRINRSGRHTDMHIVVYCKTRAARQSIPATGPHSLPCSVPGELQTRSIPLDSPRICICEHEVSSQGAGATYAKFVWTMHFFAGAAISMCKQSYYIYQFEFGQRNLTRIYMLNS